MPIHFPSHLPKLVTKRLLLREITSDDAYSYYELCSNPQVMEAYGVKAHQSPSDTLALIEFLQKQFKLQQMIRWGVFLKDDPQRLIGDVGYWRFVYPRARAEIGCKLHPQFWRGGISFEAMQSIMDYAMSTMGLNSIEGNANPENLASCAMVEKLGFVQEGYLKKHSYCEVRKEFYDTVLYSYRDTL